MEVGREEPVQPVRISSALRGQRFVLRSEHFGHLRVVTAGFHMCCRHQAMVTLARCSCRLASPCRSSAHHLPRPTALATMGPRSGTASSPSALLRSAPGPPPPAPWGAMTGPLPRPHPGIAGGVARASSSTASASAASALPETRSALMISTRSPGLKPLPVVRCDWSRSRPVVSLLGIRATVPIPGMVSAYPSARKTDATRVAVATETPSTRAAPGRSRHAQRAVPRAEAGGT
jgi:hypothetical protein